MKHLRHLMRRSCLTTASFVAAATLLQAAPAHAANRVYWANRDSDTISFANLDNSGGGGQLDTAGATLDQPLGVALDPAANKIYWANAGNNTISFANLDGSGGGGQLNTAGALPSAPLGVAANPATNKIYWANDGNNTISFANLDNSGGGGQLKTAGATVSGPEGVAINPAANKIYWANAGNNTISFANLDNSGGGGQLKTTGATLNNPRGVAINPATNKLYWANGSNNTISFANLDDSGGGGQLNTAGAAPNFPIGVAVDPATNELYTANFGNSTISFANLDNSGGGGQLNTTGTSPNFPDFPTLLKAPSGAGAPAISGGSAPGSVLSCPHGGWAPDLLGSFLYQAPRSFSYSWTRNGTPIAGATSSSINANSGGQYVCHVTASNQAGSASQASTARNVAALSCSLKPQSAHVFASTLSQAAKKHKQTPKGQLKLTVKCNESGQLAAHGRITAVIKISGKKYKTKHFKIKLVHKSITSGKSATLTVKLPQAALSALKVGAKESIVFTLTVTNSTGSTTTTTKHIKRLKLKHK